MFDSGTFGTKGKGKVNSSVSRASRLRGSEPGVVRGASRRGRLSGEISGFSSASRWRYAAIVCGAWLRKNINAHVTYRLGKVGTEGYRLGLARQRAEPAEVISR